MGTLDESVRIQFERLVKESGVKQEAIAAKLGRSQSGLSLYLSGKRSKRPTLDDLDALARYFDRSLADVLIAAGHGEHRRLTADEKLLAKWRALNSGQRAHFRQAISAVVRARHRDTPEESTG